MVCYREFLIHDMWFESIRGLGFPIPIIKIGFNSIDILNNVFMIGFPYDYGDELSGDESLINVKDFISTYSVPIFIYGLLALPAGAVDTPPVDLPIAPSPSPAALEVAQRPTVQRVIGNKGLQGSVAGVVCTYAAGTGNPVIGFICGAIFMYSMFGK